MFGNVRLRCNGINGCHINPAQGGRFCGGDCDFHTNTFRHGLYLLHHFYGTRPAFMGANATTLAVIQVRHKIAVHIFGNASFGTKNIANPTLNAFFIVPNRSFCLPTSGVVLSSASRPEYHAARIHFLPGFWPFFICHL
jgi:hypothetical protein